MALGGLPVFLFFNILSASLSLAPRKLFPVFIDLTNKIQCDAPRLCALDLGWLLGLNSGKLVTFFQNQVGKAASLWWLLCP